MLSGDDLYVFPDGTYIYYVWTDIPPATIRDKGRWNLTGDELTLTSDLEIKWNPGAERHYLLFRRESQPQEVFAVGIDRDLLYFERHAKDDPELMLLIVSKKLIGKIGPNSSAGIKKRLMREAWRPEFYNSEPLPLEKPK